MSKGIMNWVKYIGQYTDAVITEDEVIMATDAMNNDRIDDLFEEINKGYLITCDCDIDCRPNIFRPRPTKANETRTRRNNTTNNKGK